MADSPDEARGDAAGRAGRLLVCLAILAFVGANRIHNRLRADVAVLPGAIFTALMLWRPRRWILLAAAFCVAAPCLLFLRWAALVRPDGTLYFFNHLSQLMTGLLAVTGAVVVLYPARTARARR